MSPRITPLAKFIFDVYNESQRTMRGRAPNLIPPLKKALQLCLNDLVILHPPGDPNHPKVWIASVYPQNSNQFHQYLVHFDRHTGRYICNCPSFQLQQYTHTNGRVYCKHMIAVQIMQNAHRRHGRIDANNIVAKYVQANDIIIARPLQEAENVPA